MTFTISLSLLDGDPRNPNVVDVENLGKLKASIQHLGEYQPLIVRPNPDEAGRYIIIDGHHRKLVLEELGKEAVTCQVWEITDQDAQLALATLNRLRGTDIPRKRAELLASLTKTLKPVDLAALIPETEAQIKDLLKLVEANTEKMREVLKAEIAREKANLPIPLTFIIPAQDKTIWDEAYATFSEGLSDRGQVLIRICTKALEGDANGEPRRN